MMCLLQLIDLMTRSFVSKTPRTNTRGERLSDLKTSAIDVQEQYRLRNDQLLRVGEMSIAMDTSRYFMMLLQMPECVYHIAVEYSRDQWRSADDDDDDTV